MANGIYIEPIIGNAVLTYIHANEKIIKIHGF